MKETKHTELPWQVLDTSIVSGDICIAVIEDSGEYATYAEEREANAAFIVTACNHHDRLLSELKFALDTLTQETDSWRRFWYDEEPYSNIAHAIQEAEGIKPLEAEIEASKEER